MSDEERRHFNNLILLCSDCHDIIDNPSNVQEYPVALLQKWKRGHEQTRRLELQSRPSYLIRAIEAIADMKTPDPQDDISKTPSVFEIDKKIDHNKLVRNKLTIQEHRAYYSKISALYQELERNGSFKKDNLLRNVRSIYLKIHGDKLAQLKTKTIPATPNGDDIFEEVQDRLLDSCSETGALHNEDLSFGVTLIMVDAFMRCKILEEPVEQ